MSLEEKYRKYVEKLCKTFVLKYIYMHQCMCIDQQLYLISKGCWKERQPFKISRDTYKFSFTLLYPYNIHSIFRITDLK